MVWVLSACKLESHIKSKIRYLGLMYDERFKTLASRFITKHRWESWAVRIGVVQQAVKRHWCVNSGAWNRCVLWITRWKKSEMVKRRKVEWRKGGGAYLVPNTVDSQVKDRTPMKEQHSGVNQMPLLWLFTEVLHIETPQTRKGHQTQHPFPIQKIIITTADVAQPKVMLSSVASLNTCL